MPTSRGSRRSPRRPRSSLAIEDLHWAHPSTRELAEDLLELTERAPLLLVATLRRDPGSEGWRFRTRVLADFSHRATEIALEPLSPEAAREILATLLPGFLDDAAWRGARRAGRGKSALPRGAPARARRGGGAGERHRTWTTTLKPSLMLPPALENLLVARIDRLADGPRRLAQVAAVLGREFPVSSSSTSRAKSTEDGLAALLRAEIVRELRRYPEFVCGFRHGLLQEAALSSLTPPPAVDSSTARWPRRSSRSTRARSTTTSSDLPTTTRRAGISRRRGTTSTVRPRGPTSSAPDPRRRPAGARRPTVGQRLAAASTPTSCRRPRCRRRRAGGGGSSRSSARRTSGVRVDERRPGRVVAHQLDVEVLPRPCDAPRR